ncbi:MAG: hypothetical protein U9N32_05730, partial [Spirochaetota bacterium]|nr:hypothetical protein [Spirochaetota bacterium]
MLRHSISFKAKKDINVDELFFLVEEWLVTRSKGSLFLENDFKILNKKRNGEIIKGDESIKFLKYNENGLSFSSFDYTIKTSGAIYFTSVHVLKIADGTYISGRLDTFSDRVKDIPPASIPNIFKMLMGKAEGGTNGSLPILIGPLQLDYDAVISSFSDTQKPLLLPIVYIDNENSRHIDSNFLAKDLYGKTAVVAGVYDSKKVSIRKSGKINLLFLLFKGIKRSKPPLLRAEILYPDGERLVVEVLGEKAMEREIVKVIMNSQSRQFTPIDYRYISRKKEYCKAMNYKAPNFYCRAVFEIMAGLTEKERNRIEDSLSTGVKGIDNDEFLSVIKKIIYFPI